MKALVFLCLLGLGLASTHSLSKRSLLGRGRGGHGHQHHGEDHHHPQRQRQRQRSRGRRFGSRRAGRDGVHDSEHDSEHDSHHPIRAISDGYLPAAADDYDDLAGYDRAAEGQALPGYDGEEGAVTERSLDSYDYETTTTAVTTEFPDYEGSAAGERYGAPSTLDNSYAAPEGSYDASGVDVARTNTDYSAPGTDYSIPDNDLTDPQYNNQNGFPFEAVEGRTGSGAGERQCPGDSIEACVAVCPGTSVRVYGACVGGCADRCPDS